jgi:four helix bundle protein
MAEHLRNLRVYKQGFESTMRIFELSKGWPREERHSLTDQIRRSSRSVCANIAEAWRKRRYPAHFVSKLSDADAEVAETQSWLQFAKKCGYVPEEEYTRLNQEYERLAGGLVKMMSEPERWCGPAALVKEEQAVYEDGIEQT